LVPSPRPGPSSDSVGGGPSLALGRALADRVVERTAVKVAAAADALSATVVHNSTAAEEAAQALAVCRKHNVVREAGREVAKEHERRVDELRARLAKERQAHAGTLDAFAASVGDVRRLSEQALEAQQIPDYLLSLARSIEHGNINDVTQSLIQDISLNAGRKRVMVSPLTRELLNRMALHSSSSASVFAMNCLPITKRNIIAHSNATMGPSKGLVVLPLALPTVVEAAAQGKLLALLYGASSSGRSTPHPFDPPPPNPSTARAAAPTLRPTPLAPSSTRRLRDGERWAEANRPAGPSARMDQL